MIHETAIIGAAPFWYDRDTETGERRYHDHIGSDPDIGMNVDIFHFACVVTGTERHTLIGDGAKIGPRAQIGHDAHIGKHTVVGAGSIICGFADIGYRCTIGAGAIICPKVTVGDDCFIGAGVVVTEDVPPNTKLTVRGRSRNWEGLPWSG